MAHRVAGAPLVYFTLMAHQHMVRHCYIAMAHHMSGAPLVAIPSIALFLVVVKAKKHPPPEEKIDPVKAKCTVDAPKKPPMSPPKGNYERIIERSFIEAERSGSTTSDQRLAER